MNLYSREDQIFLNRLAAIIDANLNNEQFGVKQLAAKMELSHSQIHRKIKSICNKSVSQFIREIRLEKAKEFLEKGNSTVSEVAYKVGFGSPSYFVKCFHDYYGFPPGEYLKYAPENSRTKENTRRNENTTSKQPKFMKIGKSLTWLFSIVIIAATVVIVYLIFQYQNLKTTQKLDNQIVVLPFSNLGSDENTSYFADGLSIEIRNQLTKIHGLKIISGPTAEQFREHKLSSPEIARQVDANYILLGTVQQQDNDIHINIELSDAQQDRILWSGKYDRKNSDIFSIYIDIARNVVDNLHSILLPEEIEEIEKLYPKNFDAYNNYLMGQYFCLQRDSLSIRKGIEYFNKAIEIDSGYTLAYAGLADGYYALAFTGNIEKSMGYDMAYKMAEKALRKDSTIAEAYAVLGVVCKFGYWKWEEARGFFEKALEVDSNCMVAHLYYCSFLDIVGEPDKALKHVNKAIELEPYLGILYGMKGNIYRNEKKMAESTKAFRKSQELDPFRAPDALIFLNFLEMNNEASAVQTLLEYFAVHPEYQKYENRVQSVYESSGKDGLISLLLDVTLKKKKQNLRLLADLYNLLGMKGEALLCLERACRERESDIPRIIRKPQFENLHSNPRFQALVDTMNLRPYFAESSE